MTAQPPPPTHTHTHTTTENNCSGFSTLFGFLWLQLWKSSVGIEKGKLSENGGKYENRVRKETLEKPRISYLYLKYNMAEERV